MEKFKFDFSEQKNKVVKFGGQKIEIRPYVFPSECVCISELCGQQLFNKDGSQSNTSLHLVKTLCDMILTEICTNISIDGINVKYDKNIASNIKIDLKNQTVEEFVASGIDKIIKENISNYEYIWDCIKYDIKDNFSVDAIFNKITSFIPSIEEQGKLLKETSVLVDKVSKEHPVETRDFVINEVTKKKSSDPQNKSKGKLNGNKK